MEVQGEGYHAPLRALEAYNETAAEPLKNARNAAAGALRNLDPQRHRQPTAWTAYVSTTWTISRGARCADHQRNAASSSRENRLPRQPDCDAVYVTDMDGRHRRRYGEIEERAATSTYLIDGAVIV